MLGDQCFMRMRSGILPSVLLANKTAAPGQGEVNLGIETEVETCHERVKHMKVRQENLLTLS